MESTIEGIIFTPTFSMIEISLMKSSSDTFENLCRTQPDLLSIFFILTLDTS